MRKWFLKSAVLLLAACVLVLTGCPGAKGTNPTARPVSMQEFKSSGYDAKLKNVEECSVALDAAHLFQLEGQPGTMASNKKIGTDDLQKANHGKTVKAGDKFWVGFKVNKGTSTEPKIIEKVFYIELTDDDRSVYDMWEFDITKGLYEASATARLSEGSIETINTLYPTLKFKKVSTNVANIYSVVATDIKNKKHKLFVVEEKDKGTLEKEDFYKTLKTPYVKGDVDSDHVLHGLEEGKTYYARAVFLFDAEHLRNQAYASPIVGFKLADSLNEVAFNFDDGNNPTDGNANDPLSVESNGTVENGYLKLANGKKVESIKVDGVYYKGGEFSFDFKGEKLHENALETGIFFTLLDSEDKPIPSAETGYALADEKTVFTFKAGNESEVTLKYLPVVLKTTEKKKAEINSSTSVKWTVKEEGRFELSVKKANGEETKKVIFGKVTESKVPSDAVTTADLIGGDVKKKATSKRVKVWVKPRNFSFAFDTTHITVKATGDTEAIEIKEEAKKDPLFVEAGLSEGFTLTANQNGLYLDNVKYTITR